MVSLQGKINQQKYEGSYENIALAIARNVSPLHVHASLNAFYQSLVLTVALQNGDAHLKNYGLLYREPESDDCRLSPIYDVVNTTLYIEADQLALRLAKSKSWPTRNSNSH
jgi:serine/threonine-protein kinase HipA